MDSSGAIVALPIDVTPQSGQVFLILYGTGIRGAQAEQVAATIGGVNVPILFAGPQGSFVGLDQVNVQVPAALAGRGDVAIVVIVAGQAANTIHVTLK